MWFKLATSPLHAAIWALSMGPGLSYQPVTYQGFASTVSCTGSHFQCTDGGAVCCSFPTGFGYSVQFNNLPPGSQGQGYTGGECYSFLFAVFGPGTKCWNGGGLGATNMNWFHSPARSRRNRFDINFKNERSRLSGNCSSPTAFTYEDNNGVQRSIRFPLDGQAAGKIAKLYLARDFNGLLEYKDF